MRWTANDEPSLEDYPELCPECECYPCECANADEPENPDQFANYHALGVFYVDLVEMLKAYGYMPGASIKRFIAGVFDRSAEVRRERDKATAEYFNMQRAMYEAEAKSRDLQRQLSNLQSMKDEAVEFIEDIVKRSKGHGILIPVLVEQAEAKIERIKRMPA